MKFAQPRRGGLSRGTQWRLIAGIFLSALVLLLFRLNQAEPLPVPAPEGDDRPLDFAIRPGKPSGDFVTLVDAAGDAEDGADGRPLAERLDEIEDNTLGMSRREFEIAAAILAELAETPPDRLAADARDDATFVVLMQQPEAYRGKLIRLRGDLRRLSDFPSLQRYGGPDRLVEGWLFTNESETNPFRVLSLEADPSLPRGERIEPTSAEVVGVFFKRFGYATANSSHIAPMLLARRIAKPPPRPQSSPSPILPAALVFLTVCVLSLVVFRLQMRERRRKVQFRLSGSERSAPADLGEIENPGEFLDRLAEQDRSDSA